MRRGATRALLLRATVDDRAAERYVRAASASWRLVGAGGAPVLSRQTREVEGTTWHYLTVLGAERASRVRVEGVGLHAELALPAPTQVRGEPPGRGAELAATILEGTLLPGIEATAVFSSRDEVAEWRVEPVMDNAHIGREVKTRTMALVRLRVDGLGAPLSVVRRSFDGEERRDGVRLPVIPLGAMVVAPLPSFAPPEEVSVRAAVAPATVHALWGDDVGPCGWGAVRTAGEALGGAAALRFTDPACAPTWIEATTDEGLRVRSGRRLATARPALRLEGHTDLFATWPSPPPPPLLHDGARLSETTHHAKVRTARSVSVAALVASVLLEVAMVLGAGVRRGPDALAKVERSPRARAGLIAAGAALIVGLGLVMAIALILRR